ncbi:MAG: hypothetical protein WBG92_06330 [Thiohalocapsa sp.]
MTLFQEESTQNQSIITEALCGSDAREELIEALRKQGDPQD